MMSSHENHPFHMVNKSPWPMTGGIGTMSTLMGMIMWFHQYKNTLLVNGTIITILTMIQWWSDITREGTYQGVYTKPVTTGLLWGMILFIISEAFSFVSFFWASFHSSLSPTIELGSTWPPTGIKPFIPLQFPMLNTVILLASGVTVTWAHHSILENKYNQAVQSLFITAKLGIFFTALHANEYAEAPFTIADSAHLSKYFVATGLHGIHVIIGKTSLISCLMRQLTLHFSCNHQFGFEAAAWYWQFVDLVWLFLYKKVYLTSNQEICENKMSNNNNPNHSNINNHHHNNLNNSSVTSMKKINKDRENWSPFECGFDPKNSARLPFSSRFYLIAVIFMIFDVEIALLLPMRITMTSSNTWTWMAISCMFLIILIIWLYHKWNQGSLEWSK